ncbi:MAG: glucosaminidase domain-containing protein [Bacteroidales bacterium]|nr:glucosaminidase domain-containing protein [Bacteroidales bacterium]
MYGQTYELYIEKHKDIAIDQMKKTGIPASITLAQACLESAYGTSVLATKAHNHFGIKCHDWTGEKFVYNDEEGASCYRSYKKDEESFQDHSDFLRYRDRYAFLFDLNPTDYKSWAYGLRQAGYATDPQYPTKLIALIEKYQLYKYDTQIDKDALPPTPTEAETKEKIVVDKGNILYKISLEREVFSTNGVSFIVADGYETFGYLAKEYNLFKRELLRYNDLKKDGDIEAGTVIYLQPKKNQAASHLDKHVVEEGETMYSLSQRYAVKLSSLYKINNMAKGQEPAAGAIIKLRK